MFLTTVPIVKSSHNFSLDSIYLSEKRRTLNMEIFQYQIWTLVKRSEK